MDLKNVQSKPWSITSSEGIVLFYTIKNLVLKTGQ